MYSWLNIVLAVNTPALNMPSHNMGPSRITPAWRNMLVRNIWAPVRGHSCAPAHARDRGFGHPGAGFERFDVSTWLPGCLNSLVYTGRTGTP
jgi:hypothetical protein